MIKFSVFKVSILFAMGALAPGALGATQFVEAEGRVVMEAEHFTAKVEGANHPFVLVPDDALFTAGGTNATFMNARGGRFMQVQQMTAGIKAMTCRWWGRRRTWSIR